MKLPAAIRFLCLATLFLLAGCAHRLQFRVVEASTDVGLAGVKVSVEEHSSFDYFRRSERPRHAAGVTDTAGIITLAKVSSSDVVFFEAPNHRGAAAGIVRRGRVAFSPFPPVDVDTAWRDRREVSSHGIIVI